MPPLPPRLLVFVLVLAFLVGVIQFGLISIAFEKLGLSPTSAYLLLMCTLGGSLLNLPLFSLKADHPLRTDLPPQVARWPFPKLPPVTDRIVVAINVGGAVVPIAFSFYLIGHNPLNPVHIAVVVIAVAAIARLFSWPIAGIGIVIPMLIAPVGAALIATLLDPEQRAPLAYIGGTLGVLIGADLLRFQDIRKLGAPIASIGGGGTFDSVYISGLIAVLLA